MAEEVLPLCASPRSLFFGTWEVFSQSLMTLVTFVKNFRWAVPLVGSAGRASSGPLIEDNDVWWLVHSALPGSLNFIAGLDLLVHPPGLRSFRFFICSMLCCGYLIHNIVMHSIIFWYRDMPFQLMGAKAKLMIEVILMITAAAVSHLLEFSYGYIYLLLSFATYIYSFAHFMHIAYDIGGIDVLVGSVMQILVYFVGGQLLVQVFTMTICLGFSLYRYKTYCAPQVPTHFKKEELERLPC